MLKVITALVRVLIGCTLFKVLFKKLLPFYVGDELVIPTDTKLKTKVLILGGLCVLLMLYIASWSVIALFRLLCWLWAMTFGRLFRNKTAI